MIPLTFHPGHLSTNCFARTKRHEIVRMRCFVNLATMVTFCSFCLISPWLRRELGLSSREQWRTQLNLHVHCKIYNQLMQSFVCSHHENYSKENSLARFVSLKAAVTQQKNNLNWKSRRIPPLRDTRRHRLIGIMSDWHPVARHATKRDDTEL